MIKKGIKVLAVLLVLMYLTSIGWAMDLPDYTGDVYVQDFAYMIPQELEDGMKSAARILEDKTSAQIAVVTIKSLEGNDIEGYANELFRKWQIGDKEKNNGVLFLIAQQEQKFRIEVGYGLEGRINDAKAGDILREIAPYFQKGQFEQGIAQAFNKLVQEISTEYQIEAPQVSEKPITVKKVKTTDSKEVKIPFWAKALLIAAVIYLAIFHPDVLLAIIYMFSRGGGPGGFGGGSGGSRRGGGGSSGGGGASGGW